MGRIAHLAADLDAGMTPIAREIEHVSCEADVWWQLSGRQKACHWNELFTTRF